MGSFRAPSRVEIALFEIYIRRTGKRVQVEEH